MGALEELLHGIGAGKQKKELAAELDKQLEENPDSFEELKQFLTALFSPEVVESVSQVYAIPVEDLADYKKGNLLVYLANPQGFNEPGRMWLYMCMVPMLESIPNVKVMEPFILSKEYAPDIYPTQTAEKQAKLLREFDDVVIRNNRIEMELADFAIAIGDGAGVDLDAGVASEMADLYDRCPIYILRTDFRPGENLGSEGLNLESWGKITANKEKFGIGGVYHRLRALESAIRKDVTKLWGIKVERQLK